MSVLLIFFGAKDFWICVGVFIFLLLALLFYYVVSIISILAGRSYNKVKWEKKGTAKL